MTCIIALKRDNRLWMGGDTAGVNISSYGIQSRKDSKIFKKGNMLIGFTTSFRMGQILRYKLKIKKQKEGQEDFEYMCTDFIDDVRKGLKDNNFSRILENRESGGTFIVCYKGEIYSIEDDFQVASCFNDFAICGSGSDIALGAMGILIENLSLDPENILIKALEIASKYSITVRGPYNILSIAIKQKH